MPPKVEKPIAAATSWVEDGEGEGEGFRVVIVAGWARLMFGNSGGRRWVLEEEW